MKPPRKKRKLTFIIHGSRSEQPALRHVVEWVRAKGHIVDPRVTWESGDAWRFASEAADRNMDTIVAVGGDGTVNEVVNGLDGKSAALGIIPLGTANDFARQTGIAEDADHAMDVVLQRKPITVDTAEMNGRRFLNVSTGGVGAETTAETPADAKETLGRLAYALTGVRKLSSLSPTRAQFTAPGYELDCEMLLFAVGNARATGGGSLLTPNALLNDGLLDVCIVEATPLAQLAKLFLKLRRGEHIGEEGVHYFQVPSLTVEATAAISVNVDGESSEARRLEYRARPGDLKVHVSHLPGFEPE
ncbi:MAG: diacylglycerol kinase family protein [Gemmatimonadaceae bacterium]